MDLMSTKIKFLLTAFFALLSMALSAQDFTELKSLPRNFEFEVANVNIVITAVNGDKMQYLAELPDGKRLSCVEHRGNFRVRSLYKTKGTLYVRVPKTHLFEQIRITASMSNVTVKGINAVNFILVSTRGNISIADSVFKTSNLVQNLGVMEFSVNVLRASAICVNYVKARIEYIGESKSYHIDYGQGLSTMYLSGEKIKPRQGTWGSENAKKRTIISAGNSRVDIFFKSAKEVDTQ